MIMRDNLAATNGTNDLLVLYPRYKRRLIAAPPAPVAAYIRPCTSLTRPPWLPYNEWQAASLSLQDRLEFVEDSAGSLVAGKFEEFYFITAVSAECVRV